MLSIKINIKIKKLCTNILCIHRKHQTSIFVVTLRRKQINLTQLGCFPTTRHFPSSILSKSKQENRHIA